MRPPFKGPAQVMWQVCIYGIKVSFWGSGTLKIVIYVQSTSKTTPPETKFLVG